jgi:hypothetical protein
MYHPALPNHYRDVVFTAYVRRRQREEAAAAEEQRRPNALACALSSLNSPSAFSEVAAESSGLHLSAEELHRHRIAASAALGIQSAVAMEKDALEVEHKRKKLEGEDARSRISSRLDKLKSLAAKSKKLTGGGGKEATMEQPEATGTSASCGPASVSTASADASSFAAEPIAATPSTASAPLVFQRSSMAAGGYVMTTAPTTSSSAATSSLLPLSKSAAASAAAGQRAIRGKPSSTLLLRYRRDSPVCQWSEEQISHAATSGTEATAALCAPVVSQVHQLCCRFGFVRGVKARVHTPETVASVLGIAASDRAALQDEQLRLWVRYDSVTEAFKAAESLAKEPGSVDGPLLCVCFYPTSLFDADTLDVRVEEGRVVS